MVHKVRAPGYRLNTSAGPLLDPVSEYIFAIGRPKYVHRDHIIDYLVDMGKTGGRNELVLKKSVSCCIILNKYERLSRSSNAYKRIDDGDKEGKLPASEPDAEPIPGSTSTTG